MKLIKLAVGMAAGCFAIASLNGVAVANTGSNIAYSSTQCPAGTPTWDQVKDLKVSAAISLVPQEYRDEVLSNHYYQQYKDRKVSDLPTWVVLMIKSKLAAACHGKPAAKPSHGVTTAPGGPTSSPVLPPKGRIDTGDGSLYGQS